MPMINVSHASTSSQGLRPSMEDFQDSFMAKVCVNGKHRNVFVQYVCDGHGGPNVARFVCSQVRTMFDTCLGSHAEKYNNMADMLTAMVLCIAADVKTCVKDSSRSGTTLCMSVLDIAEATVYVVNCGDSRCAIYDIDSGKQLLQSKDHCATDEGEATRVMDSGGLVFRVRGLPRVMGTLAITRAIGDTDLAPYVIPDPDVYHVRISSPTLIVVASDGYWNVARGMGPNSPVRCWSNTMDAKQVIDALVKGRSFADNAAILVSIALP